MREIFPSGDSNVIITIPSCEECIDINICDKSTDESEAFECQQNEE